MCKSWLSVATLVVLSGPAVAQVYVPIPVTGYTQDVIADAVGVASATTTIGFDTDPYNGLNLHNVFFQQGYNTGGSSNGVPVTGAIVTSANRAYQLGPINGNNSLFLTQLNRTGMLTFVTPAREAGFLYCLEPGMEEAQALGACRCAGRELVERTILDFPLHSIRLGQTRRHLWSKFGRSDRRIRSDRSEYRP